MITRRAMVAAGAGLSVAWGARAAAPLAPLLGPIRGVLTTTDDLAAVEHAYTTVLGYQVVERGLVSGHTAAAWGAPGVAGRGYLAMRPASGQPVLLRFVQQAQPANFRPMTTFGWNATEIIVQDCDQVSERLKGTPFRMVAPPRPLSGNNEIRAMQAIGPANEMLYLTAVTKPLPPERDMPTAEAFVGRCFIAVAGGPSLAGMAAFYRDTFGNETGASFNSPINSLSIQNRLPGDTRYDLAVTQLGGGSKIELDAYPSVAGARLRRPGELPPGMAMVSFACTAFDHFIDKMISPPHAAADGAFPGRRTGVIAGAASELIELIET